MRPSQPAHRLGMIGSRIQRLRPFWIFWIEFRHNPRLKLVRYAFSGIAVSAGYTVTVALLVDGFAG